MEKVERSQVTMKQVEITGNHGEGKRSQVTMERVKRSQVTM